MSSHKLASRHGSMRMQALLIRLTIMAAAMGTIAGVYFLSSWIGGAPSSMPHSHHPFSAGLQERGSEATGIGHQILAIQSAFYSRMVSALKDFTNPAAQGTFWTLVGLGFAYGIFHAAGPGHGKVIISGYLVADGRRSLKRGLTIAFISSMFQAFSAIMLVSVLVLLLNATKSSINASAQLIEIASFASIAVIGCIMLWHKAGKIAFGLQQSTERLASEASLSSGAHAVCDHSLPLDKGRASGCQHAPRHGTDCCDHAHIPLPGTLKETASLREMLLIAVSAGIRPCTGAIIILVFALSQQQFAAGIAATLAMSLGTFMTVSVLACFAVFAARTAEKLAHRNRRYGSYAIAALEVLACALIAVTGIVLMAAAYHSG